MAQRDDDDLSAPSDERSVGLPRLAAGDLIAAMQDGFSILDARGVHLDVNPALCAMTGFTRDELVGTGPPHPYWPPEELDAIGRALAHAKRGLKETYALTFMRKNGERFPVLVTPSLIDGPDGDGVRCFATVKDVTEATRMERALQESEERYRLLLENASDAVYVHELTPDEPGRFLEVNQRACDMLGYTHEELLAMQVPEIDVPEQRDRLPGIIGSLFEGGAAVFETEHLASDGRRIPVEVSTRLFDLRGRPTVLSVARDITERKQAQLELGRRTAELERQRAFLATLLDTIPLPVFYKDRQGGCLGCNRAYSDVVGRSEQEIVGTTPTDIWGPTVGAVFARKDRELYEHPGTQTYETALPAADGSLRDMVVNKATFAGHDGSVEGIIGVMLDITERRRVEESLRISEEKFAKAFEASPDAFLLTAVPDGRIVEVNAGTIRMSGYAREELIGRTTAELALWADPAVRDEYIDRIRHEGRVERFPFAFRTSSGETRDGQISGEVIELRDGPYFLSVIRDVTEQKHAEEALLRAAEEWRRTFDAVPDLIATIDTHHRITRLNQAMAERLGKAPEDVVGLTCFEVVHGLAEPPDFCPHKRLLSSGAPEREEVEEKHLGGIFDVTTTPLHGEGGELLGSVHVARDITDRRLAEEALRTSEARYETFLNATDDIAFLKDDELRYVIVNRAYAEFLGRSAEEIVGCTDAELMPPEAAEGCRRSDLAALERGETVIDEEPVGDRLYEARKFAVPIEGGRLGVGGYVRDVTAQRQADKAVEASEQKYRSLFDQSVEGIFLHDREGRILDANRMACDQTGYSKDELLQLTVFDLHAQDPDTINLPRDLILATWDTWELGQRVVIEAEHRRRDGTVFPVQVSTGPIRYEDRDLILALVRDISEQKEVDTALREATEELDSYFNAALDLFCIADTTGHFRRLNPQWESVLGYNLEDLMSRPFIDLVHPDDVEATLAAVGTLRAGEPVMGFVNRYRRADGTYRWIEWRSRPAGELIYAAARDITERREAEAALAESAERLRATLHDTVQAMGEIVGLRDPYTARHEKSVTRLAVAVADEMGLDDDTREGLMLAGQVHDIGKICVPAEILSKPAALTDMEYRLVQQHAQTGREILAGIAFRQPVAEIVGQHHERCDGSGYPNGLSCDEIRMEARILAVADVIEAMASHRPYRAALGMEAALAEVRAGAGTLYDVDVVSACERVIAAGFLIDD